jgi:hypothetical protein
VTTPNEHSAVNRIEEKASRRFMYTPRKRYTQKKCTPRRYGLIIKKLSLNNYETSIGCASPIQDF